MNLTDKISEPVDLIFQQDEKDRKDTNRKYDRGVVCNAEEYIRGWEIKSHRGRRALFRLGQIRPEV